MTVFRIKPTATRVISVGAFRRRLTTAEKIAVKQSTDPVVQVLDDDLVVNEFIDLDFQDLHDGLDYLISVGILQPERKSELLADGTPDEAA